MQASGPRRRKRRTGQADLCALCKNVCVKECLGHEIKIAQPLLRCSIKVLLAFFCTAAAGFMGFRADGPVNRAGTYDKMAESTQHGVTNPATQAMG